MQPESDERASSSSAFDSANADQPAVAVAESAGLALAPQPGADPDDEPMSGSLDDHAFALER